MKTRTWSNAEKIAVLLVLLGTVMMVGGGFNGKIETQLAGLIMWLGGALQLVICRMRRLEATIHQRHP